MPFSNTQNLSAQQLAKTPAAMAIDLNQFVTFGKVQQSDGVTALVIKRFIYSIPKPACTAT